MKRLNLASCYLAITIFSVCFLTVSCYAQNDRDADARYSQLENRLNEALTVLGETQKELLESRKQIHDLELRMQAIDGHPNNGNENVNAEINNPAASDMQEAVRRLQENTEILQAEVKQHEQTKIESSSKYPIKMSGILLSSTFLTDGAVDNVDLPVIALPRTHYVAHGSLASSFRQSILGFDFFGPIVWGARSAADVRIDFFGGQPTGGYGTNGGTVRLRTAHIHVDWPNSSLIASLDAPLISPLDPTSYVSTGEPAMAWAGNLWSWSPQIEFKQHLPISNKNRFDLEFGVIDPAAPDSLFSGTLRQANPSENSRKPGYEGRFSYAFGSGDRALTIGAGGYYSRQAYPYKQHVDAWAGSADWKLPLGKHFELSGELYRGRGLGSLGGGTFKDYLTYNDNRIRGLDAEGGWTQLKARLTPAVEVNAAIGQDSAFARQLYDETNSTSSTIYSGLARNRMTLGNIIYRPKAYLLFSMEYRKIQSWQIYSTGNDAQSLGLAIGYLY